MVSGPEYSAALAPEWKWTSGGSGSGKYRYKMNNDILEIGATPINAASYKPNLSDGTYTLYVQEKDSAGNWSDSGSFKIIVDTQKPGTPIVKGPTPTNSLTPEWTWVSGGKGNGWYEYKLNDDDFTTDVTPLFPMKL